MQPLLTLLLRARRRQPRLFFFSFRLFSAQSPDYNL
jgi:hypothetical protein